MLVLHVRPQAQAQRRDDAGAASLDPRAWQLGAGRLERLGVIIASSRYVITFGSR